MANEYDYIQEQSARIVDLAVEVDTLKRRIAALESDLAAEREAHAEEKRRADGLASTMLESASILDLDEHTDEIAGVIRDLFNALRAHDARRSEELKA